MKHVQELDAMLAIHLKVAEMEQYFDFSKKSEAHLEGLVQHLFDELERANVRIVELLNNNKREKQ